MEQGPAGRYILYFDGSSFGNGRRSGPGPSAGAAVLVGPDGMQSKSSVYVRSGDSDMAEYLGLLCGLRDALDHPVKSLSIRGDSRNIIDQVLGRKPLQKPSLVKLRDQVLDQLPKFADWELQWIPRHKNGLADHEARQCIAKAISPPILDSSVQAKELCSLT